MGVHTWDRFDSLMAMVLEDPQFVIQYMKIQGEFTALLADKILRDVQVEAVIINEPIGGNEGALISPQMYEEFALENYVPLLNIVKNHGITNIIVRTYANMRVLIPSILKYGINCLWACETNSEVMDYVELRSEFGGDLRLIGGLDLDTLRQDKDAIQRELETKLPPLLSQGGYVPLADGRVRADIPYENYIFYRQLLTEMTNKLRR
jgi:uroporphyrinogen-III decarboxylase